MNTALIGLVGVLLGIVISEVLRRRNRIESYATRVFDKRLEIYEGLYERVSAAGEIATDVIENPKYSPEQRHEITSAAILEIAGWCDKNEMYIGVELSLLCTPLLMGVEEIYNEQDSGEKQSHIAHFREDFRNTKKMIRKEAGIEDIERMFSSITKAKYTSPIIKYYRAKKRELAAKGKWD